MKIFRLKKLMGRTSLIDPNNEMKIHFNGLSSGVYDEQSVHVFIDDEDFGPLGYSISCEQSAWGCGLDDFNVTHFESTGGILRISFSGVMWMQTIEPPLAGNFPIEGVIVTRR